MRRLIPILIAILLFCGCGTVRYVPVEVQTDSVYVEKIVERLDTVRIEIPGEVQYVAIPADSSHIETSVAISDAWVDSLSILHHRLRNRAGFELQKEVVYQDRIIEKSVDREVPVIKEVEKTVEVVPAYYKWVNGLFWGIIGIFVIFILIKVKFL